MKYIKTYENHSNEDYREINVRDLFKIFISNMSFFSEYQKYKSDVFNFNLILSEIIGDQKISFYGKTFNDRRYRDIKGIVKNISLWKHGGSPFSMELFLSKKKCSENHYDNTIFDVDIDVPIKIYSKEISEIENRFHVVKDMKKYNL